MKPEIGLFNKKAIGVSTARDPWVYNYSKKNLSKIDKRIRHWMPESI